MASNKNSRHTNEGYLSRQNLPKQNRQQHLLKARSISSSYQNTQPKRIQANKQQTQAIKQQPGFSKNTLTKKSQPYQNIQHKKQSSQHQFNKQQLKNKPLTYSHESEEEDSEYEYSFNNNKINSKKDQQVVASSKKSIENGKKQFNAQEQRKMQENVQLLELSLKQAYCQNQLLRQKLYQSQQNYSLLQSAYEQLQHSHQTLQSQHILSKQKQRTHMQQEKFITQCQQEITKLKTLVNELTEQKYRLELSQAPSEREEIKDRIIMKLQDQLITVKLLLQEEKAKHNQHKNNTNNTPDYYWKQPLHQTTTNYTNHTNRFTINHDYSAGKKTRSNYD